MGKCDSIGLFSSRRMLSSDTKNYIIDSNDDDILYLSKSAEGFPLFTQLNRVCCIEFCVSRQFLLPRSRNTTSYTITYVLLDHQDELLRGKFLNWTFQQQDASNDRHAYSICLAILVFLLLTYDHVLNQISSISFKFQCKICIHSQDIQERVIVSSMPELSKWKGESLE